MVWDWIWKISPKNVKFFNFFLFGSKSTWVNVQVSLFLLRIKSMLGLGQGPSLVQTNASLGTYSKSLATHEFAYLIVMGPGWPGSDRVSHLWFEFGKFLPKISNFSLQYWSLWAGGFGIRLGSWGSGFKPRHFQADATRICLHTSKRSRPISTPASAFCTEGLTLLIVYSMPGKINHLKVH